MTDRERQVIEMLHQRSHVAEDDPEDIVFLSLTKQEVYLLLLGQCITAVSLRCLEALCRVLRQNGFTNYSVRPRPDDWRPS